MKSDFRKSENKRYSKSKNSVGIYEVAKRVLTERMTELENKLKETPTKQELGRRRRRVLATISAGTIGIASLIGTGVLKKETNNENEYTIIGNEEAGFNYITKYAYTNAYKEKPDNNKIDKMYEGDVIEYNPQEEGYYYKVNDTWEKGPIQDSITKTSWVKCKSVIGDEDGFVPSVYVDHYYPYKVSDTATFIAEVRHGDTDFQQIERNLDRSRVWIFDEFAIDEENGFYSAIIRDENDQYLKGKILLEGLEKDRKNKASLGIMNSSTFIREYPLVTELDENVLIRNEDDNKLVRIYNGEKVKVKEEIQDKDELWYKCEVEGHEGEIYLASVALKPIKDYETEMEIIADNGKIMSLDGTERYALKKGDKIQVDLESKTNSGLYSVMIDKGNESFVGYMTAENLGLDEKIKEEIKKENENVNLIPVTEEKKNSYKYILDFGYCDNYPGVEAVVNDLIERDLLAGICIRVGTTSRNGNDFEIYNFTDDKDEFVNAGEDVVLLDNGYQEMQKNSSEHIYFNGKLGSIKNLERFIKLAVDNDLAFGTYYYQGSNDKNRTSAEAAYMYNLDKKLKADMGETYINAKKLPFMDDFEDAQKDVDVDYSRLKQFKYKTELLGNGIKEDGFWTIDNVDPEIGYHLLDDYNNRITFYSAIMPTCNINSNSFFEIENELEEEGYTVIYNSTRALDYMEISYDEIVNIENIKDFTVNKMNWYINNKETFDEKIYNRSDLIQTFLDVSSFKGQGIDLSLASQKTIDEIVSGTYTHNCTFEEQLQEVENGEKYTITTYKTLDSENDKEILDENNEKQVEKELQSEETEMQAEKELKTETTMAEAEITEKTTGRVAQITKKAEIEEDIDGR